MPALTCVTSPRSAGMDAANRNRGGRFHRPGGPGPSGFGARDRVLDQLVLDRHGGQHDARHHGRTRPSARGARRRHGLASASRAASPVPTSGATGVERAMTQDSAERLALAAGSLPAFGTLPEPYPFETVAPEREGYVERDGVRSWYAQYGASGPWLAFAPVFQIGNTHLHKGVVSYLAQHFRVTTASVPMLPEAPARFSTTTGRPRRSARCGPIWRAIRSAGTGRERHDQARRRLGLRPGTCAGERNHGSEQGSSVQGHGISAGSQVGWLGYQQSVGQPHRG